MNCLDKTVVIAHEELFPKSFQYETAKFGAESKKKAREVAADIMLTAFYPDDHHINPNNEKFSLTADKMYRERVANMIRLKNIQNKL